ncbi:MAG TPA: hypothetical protein VG826_30405 [Pirellulales bacterium]|nr:hypothetical protein [Pirellulales bacterium]
MAFPLVAAGLAMAEEPALKTVVLLGGRYEREANDPGKPVVFISLGNTKATDAVLKEIPSLETLSLSCTGITDAGLKELTPFKHLKTL